jgi:hypothetical protein
MYELETMQMKDCMTESSLPVRYSIHSFASLNITAIAKKKRLCRWKEREHILSTTIYTKITGQGE